MSNNDSSNTPVAHANFNTYMTGLILSVVLTLIPFWIVIQDLMKGWTLVLVLMGFAVCQLLIQLFFFLHLGKESRPRWNQTALVFALFFVVVIVLGSIWIMYSLDYNMHTDRKSPAEVEKMLLEDENYKR